MNGPRDQWNLWPVEPCIGERFLTVAQVAIEVKQQKVIASICKFVTRNRLTAFTAIGAAQLYRVTLDSRY